MSVTAIQQAPPEPVEPVYPGPDTIFVGPPTWSGPNYVGNPEPKIVCFTVEILTTSEEKVPWTVVIETDQPPFNNVPPFEGFQGGLYAGDATYTFAKAPDYATTGRYLVTPDYSFQWASATESYTVRACAIEVPEAAWQPAGPETYTQRPVIFVPNGGMPCVAVTVDGHQPFYVGFTVSFNWKTFLDAQLTAGTITQTEYSQWITYTHWDGGPPGYPNLATGATGADYLVTLQGYAAAGRNVANFEPVTIASCAY
ncbi:hypothetical protein [Microbacterium sp. CFBP9034]|uniref:hypothetical protein n=1 Tax=Microbacterium sp. CFBP9034 TaxID=3096540 RepID=UPI002A69E1E6|nr:hypothetical protein [Microbacterium sp. CFBP9034]MDY0909426.1 hypothetical protein [Microbacterium sp. CFBP9034]